MSVVVENSSDSAIKVSVNRWGTGGKTGYFKLSAKENGTWDREDKRGFVVSIIRIDNNSGKEESAKQYYAGPYSTLDYNYQNGKPEVKEHGKVVDALTYENAK